MTPNGNHMSDGSRQVPNKPTVVARRFLDNEWDSTTNSAKLFAFKCKSSFGETSISVTGWDQWNNDKFAIERLRRRHRTKPKPCKVTGKMKCQRPGVCLLDVSLVELAGLELEYMADEKDSEFGQAHWNLRPCPDTPQQGELRRLSLDRYLATPTWDYPWMANIQHWILSLFAKKSRLR